MYCQRIALSLFAAGLACAAAGAPARHGWEASGLQRHLESSVAHPARTAGRASDKPRSTQAEATAFEAKHRGKPPERAPGGTIPSAGSRRNGGRRTSGWRVSAGRCVAQRSSRPPMADGRSRPRPERSTRRAAAPALRRRATRKPATPPSGASKRAGAPPSRTASRPTYQFVQAGDRMAIYSEYMHDVRVVRISKAPHGGDLRHPPADIRFAGGDSIGWWKRCHLVI